MPRGAGLFAGMSREREPHHLNPSHPKPEPGMPLSLQETKILKEAAKAKLTPEIAREHEMTPQEVKDHLRSIFVKLDVNSSSEAAALYLEAQERPERLSNKKLKAFGIPKPERKLFEAKPFKLILLPNYKWAVQTQLAEHDHLSARHGVITVPISSIEMMRPLFEGLTPRAVGEHLRVSEITIYSRIYELYRRFSIDGKVSERRAKLDSIARRLVNLGIEEIPYKIESSVMLTPRQREVLRLMALGLFDEEIQSRLGVKRPTIRDHTRKIFSELEVENRYQAVVRGIEIGLLSIEELAFALKLREYRVNRLSSQQRKILEFLSDDQKQLTFKLIGKELSISEKTMGRKLKEILKTLGVKNRTQATVLYLAYKKGLDKSTHDA